MSGFSRVLTGLPELGVGLGLRREMHEATLQATNEIRWLEFTPEEFMGANGKSMQRLEEAAAKLPLISHGINLSLGSTDDLNLQYLATLKALLEKFDVPWWSDHVCFASADGVYVNNLLPLPRNKATVKHLVRRIRQAQDYIERPLLVENISFYMPNPPGSDYSEAQFIAEIIEQADCGLLLDVNNVIVNSINHGFDPFEFVNKIPLERVVQIHLAGHNYFEDKAIDTHSEAVCDPVFELLDHVLKKVQPKGIMVERDGNFPDFLDILNELNRIQQLIDRNVEPRDSAASSPITVSTTESEKKSAGKKIKKSAREKSSERTAKKIVLSKVERVFSRAVIDKSARNRIVSCLSHGCSKNCPQDCTGGFGKLHADELDLYARITEAGALAAMTTMYPVTKRLLDDYWIDAVDVYFKCHPPTGYVLAFIGEKFPEFLDSIQYQLPVKFAAAMADFEWHRIQCVESGAFENVELLTPDFTPHTNPDIRKPVLNPTLKVRHYEVAISRIHRELFKNDDACISRIAMGEAETVAFYRAPADQEAEIHPLEDRFVPILEEAASCKSYTNLFQRLLTRENADRPVQQIQKYVSAVKQLYDWKLILGDCAVVAPKKRTLAMQSKS